MSEQKTERKWQTTAGPIQSKKVREAISALTREGQTYTEILGVKGAGQLESQLWSPFSPAREEASKAVLAVAEKFNYIVTRENYTQVIAEAQAQLIELRKSRPVIDKSRTPEEDAQRNKEMRERDETRRQAEELKQEEVKARAVEVRKQFPWAVLADGRMSEHARAAQNLKTLLAKEFPGISFSVRSDYNSLSVSWEYGPTETKLREVANIFRSGHFDGQTDSHESDNSVLGKAIDIVLGRVRYISASRRLPFGSEVLELIGQRMCELKLKPQLAMEDRSLIEGESDTLRDHVWRLLHNTQFPAGTWEVVGLTEAPEDPDPHIWCKVELEATEAPAAVAPSIGTSGVIVRRNVEHDGVEIKFPSKPSKDLIDRCKANGFRWSTRGAVWYKKFSPGAWAVAHQIAGIAEPAEIQPPAKSEQPDPAGAYVQAQEDAWQDNIAQQIGA